MRYQVKLRMLKPKDDSLVSEPMLLSNNLESNPNEGVDHRDDRQASDGRLVDRVAKWAQVVQATLVRSTSRSSGSSTASGSSK